MPSKFENPTVPLHPYYTVSPDGTKMIFFFNPINGQMFQPFGLSISAKEASNTEMLKANAEGKLMDPLTGSIFTPEI